MPLGSGIEWLWCRLAAAAPIPPLAWELPYATDEAREGVVTLNRENKQTKMSAKTFHATKKDMLNAKSRDG